MQPKPSPILADGTARGRFVHLDGHTRQRKVCVGGGAWPEWANQEPVYCLGNVFFAVCPAQQRSQVHSQYQGGKRFNIERIARRGLLGWQAIVEHVSGMTELPKQAASYSFPHPRHFLLAVPAHIRPLDSLFSHSLHPAWKLNTLF